MIDPTIGTRQFREPYLTNYDNLPKQDPDETYRGYTIHRLDGDSNLVELKSTTGKPLPAMLQQQFTRRDLARLCIDKFLTDAT